MCVTDFYYHSFTLTLRALCCFSAIFVGSQVSSREWLRLALASVFISAALGKEECQIGLVRSSQLLTRDCYARGSRFLLIWDIDMERITSFFPRQV